MNTFGLDRPLYSFGLGLVLSLIDPTVPADLVTLYPTDSRYFLVATGWESAGYTKKPCPELEMFCAIKDPQETLFYNFDYTVIMETTDPADIIIASTWVIQDSDGSLSIQGSGFEDVKTNVHLAGGGKLGSLWRVTNHITTSDGREYERTIYLTIQAK